MKTFDAADSADRKGWVVGDFMPAGDPRKTFNVEIKYGRHKKGEKRTEWSLIKRHTLSILVRGKFVVRSRNGESTATAEKILCKEGESVLWVPGEYHAWEALEDCLVITIRW